MMFGRKYTSLVSIALSLSGAMFATAQDNNPLRSVPTAVATYDSAHFSSETTSARIIHAQPYTEPAIAAATQPETDTRPAEDIPPEVYQAMYPDTPPAEPVYADPAVVPATHAAPADVRRLPPQVESPRVATALQQMDAPRHNLAALEQVLTSVHAATHVSAAASREVEPAMPQPEAEWGFDTDATSEITLAPRDDESQFDFQPGIADQTPTVTTSDSTASATDLRKMIERLAISTCIVLCGGVGFIFVAKQWIKFKAPSAKAPEASIQIKSTLQLSPKSSLHLVQAGGHRLMVATDQNGIKSVVPLNESFSDTLSALESGEEAASLMGVGQIDSFSPSDPVSTRPSVDRPKIQRPSAENSLPQPPTKPDRSLPPEMYSLASVGKKAAAQQPATRSTALPPMTAAETAKSKPTISDALRDQTLRDLLLRSLETK